MKYSDPLRKLVRTLTIRAGNYLSQAVANTISKAWHLLSEQFDKQNTLVKMLQQNTKSAENNLILQQDKFYFII